MYLNHRGGGRVYFRWLASGAGIASFSAAVAIAPSQKQRQCDANHMQFRVKFEGTQTSADSRLSGKITIRAVSVVNTQNGYGSVRAKVRISDAATDKPKLHGLAVGV